MSFWVWFVLALIALVVMLLVSYLRLETFLSERGQQLKLHWLGNHIAFDIQKREFTWQLFAWHILRKPVVSTQPKAREEKKTRENREEGKVSFTVLRQERQRLGKVWRYLKRSINLEHFELNARLATPDPLWTGMLYGMVSSIIYPLQAFWPKAQLRLQPDFAHDLPSGTLNIALGVRIFRIVVLGFKVFPIVRKLRQPRDRKEKLYGSSNPTQRTRRGHASSS
jgi:hypothetical protein